MIFTAYGHPNITSSHKTTLEFAKDKELTKDGSCIVGVNSDFSLNQLKKIINMSEMQGISEHAQKSSIFDKNKKIKIIMKVNNLSEEINCEANPDFNDDKEIVIRKTDFVSERTLGVKADKAAGDLSRELVEKLRQGNKIKVIIFTVK